MTQNETTGEKGSRGTLWCLLGVLGFSRMIFFKDERFPPSVSTLGKDPVAG